MRKFSPRKQCPDLHGEARAAAEMLLADIGYKKIPGLSSINRIFVVDQRRGFARVSQDTLTIPRWIFPGGYDWHKKDIDMVVYYVAHEMAHFFAYWGRQRVDLLTVRPVMMTVCDIGHTLHFMKWFKRICPRQYWHFEAAYTPMSTTHEAAVVAAGIKRKT